MQTHADTPEAATLESFPPNTDPNVESSSHSTGNSSGIPILEHKVESSSPITYNSNVIDISKTLSRSEKNILERGLTFCPTNNRVNEYELHKDLTEFARRMRIKELFLKIKTITRSTSPHFVHQALGRQALRNLRNLTCT